MVIRRNLEILYDKILATTLLGSEKALENATKLTHLYLNDARKNIASEHFESHSDRRSNKEIPYINLPTAILVGALGRLINNEKKFQTPEVKEAFAAYQEVCQKTPAIMGYIDRHTDPKSPEAGLTKKQFTLLNASTIFRSSSTYATIPGAVAILQANGLRHEAEAIHRNAHEEIGGKKSHVEMLYDSMEILGRATGCTSLNENSYNMARQILRLRQLPEFGQEFGNFPAKDYGRFVQQMNEEGQKLKGLWYFPDSPHVYPRDFFDAVEICNLVPPSIADYHTEVIRAIVGSGGFTCDSDVLHPNNAKQLAIALFELATREASSVDEHGTGRLSFIGARGKFVNQYLGYLHKPKNKRRINNPDFDELNLVTQWSEVHSDPEIGKAGGWTDDAESGHASDARHIALDVMSPLNPEDFTAVLREVTRLSELRLKFWKDIVTQLDELGRIDKDNPLPLKAEPSRQR